MERIGRYFIEAEIGRGAMGIVYRARDTAIGRTVAIKTIRLNDLASPNEQARLRDRLLREAQSAGILSHPGIVTIFDVSEENGVAYVAMEYVKGDTLDRVAASTPLDGQTVLAILTQTAAALDYAHKRGIVHRDIKPANIMIDEGPTAKIADFGVAKIQSQEMTQSGSMIGTPNYMSPEQIRGRTVDGKSDQFSLAVIAYELLTGEKPFAADSIAGLAFKIVNEQPAPAQQLNPTLDWPVDTVLRRGLSKNADERYPSCSDFVFALENACRACKKWTPLPPGSAQSMATIADRTIVPVVLPAMATAPPPVAVEDTSEPEGVPTPLRWARVVAAIMLGGAAIGALVIGGMRYFEEEPAPEQTAQVTPPPAPAPEATAVKKPSAMPSLPGDRGDNAAPPEPEPEPPPPSEPKPSAAAAKPSARSGEARIVTNPPGATVVVDGDPAQTCKSPCSIELPPGRHTLAATLSGYRQALRIFTTPGESELFLNLDKASGTVMVRSEPSGATIIVDGQTRSEKTPAVLSLPAGSHTIEIVRDGQRESHPVTVRESAITNVQVSFQ